MIRFKLEEGFYQSFDENVIRNSFTPAKVMGPNSIAKTYQYLFADYPESPKYFAFKDMQKQFESMLMAFSFVIDNLHDEIKIRSYLNHLGRRHVDYGATDSHYEWVANSIVKSLAHLHGERWTRELNEEWRKFLNVVKGMMREGHHAARGGDSVGGAR